MLPNEDGSRAHRAYMLWTGGKRHHRRYVHFALLRRVG